MQASLFEPIPLTAEEVDFWDYCKTDIGQKGIEYDQINPHVFELFKKYSRIALEAGRDQYSANAIFERIRWHTDIETKGEEFKISNNYRAFYARKLMAEDPAYKGFFVTK